MDYQQPRGYMRPPPAADPYLRTPPPLPPNHPWPYSGTQSQYQHQTQQYPSHPPPPPPYPPHQQMHYPAHQPPSYPGQHPSSYHSHFHYPQPYQLPPGPPPYPQDWGTANWTRHQSWNYTNTDNNEEDWAAKARAWAAAKAAPDNHANESHFTPASSNENQNHFHDQYPQSLVPQSHDMHKPLYPTSNYQQYPAAAGPPTRTGMQDSQKISSEGSPYAAETHMQFSAGNESQNGDSASLPCQEKSSITPIVHQQEVPSSYSSVAGNEKTGKSIEKFDSVASYAQYHVQPLQSADGRPGWVEEHQQVFGNPPESVANLSDQPLNFSPHFNHARDPHILPSHNHSSGAPLRGPDPALAISSSYAWPPSSAPVSVYGPVPPPMPSGPQRDHPMSMPPPSAHSAFPVGPGFQPNAPLIGTVFGGSSGAALHPTSFSGDAYGFSERPKKASVPNWLREEIIKINVIPASSGPKIPNNDSQFIEEGSNNRSSWNSDQPDSKTTDSVRSVGDDDEDEDEVEAARTAAINQEIKHILTEVLLKVTDELFDEIATKVLKEDDLIAKVELLELNISNDAMHIGSQRKRPLCIITRVRPRTSDPPNPNIVGNILAGSHIDLSKHQMLLSTPSIVTSMASAKVLLPAKTKGSDNDDGSEKSTLGSPGDILGLANYASDGEDDEIKNSSKLNHKVGYAYQQTSSDRLMESRPLIENGGYSEESREQRTNWTELDTESTRQRSPLHANTDRSSGSTGRLSDESQNVSDTSKITNSVIEMIAGGNGRSDGNLGTGRLSDASGVKMTAKRYQENDVHENRKNLVKQDHRDSESLKEEIDSKGREEHRSHEKNERANYNDNLKDKGKEKGRIDDKVKSAGSRRLQSAYGVKEEMVGMRREKIYSGREDDYERRQDREADEMKERAEHKSGCNTSRHKQERSSSVGARGRASKDSSAASRDSSDESYYSKRKLHHSRRRKSPSPVRTSKRQVSPSAHSKHSKRRHSPYSSLETTRRRRSPSRSRSRSPVRRRR